MISTVLRGSFLGASRRTQTLSASLTSINAALFHHLTPAAATVSGVASNGPANVKPQTSNPSGDGLAISELGISPEIVKALGGKGIEKLFSIEGLRSSDFRSKSHEEEINRRKLPRDYDPKEHLSPPTERVLRLVDQISYLTLSEIFELGAIVMKKKGITELPLSEEEKNVFEVKLEGFEASAKIKIIKEVRNFTDLGLKGAKELTDKTPCVLKSGLSKEEGEKIVEKLKALGAEAVLEAKPEKTVFKVKLEGFEASAKLKIMKEVMSFADLGLMEAKELVMSFTDLGLKEAKELAEKTTPCVWKAGLSKEEGEKIVEKLEALGAKVVVE